MHDYDLLVIGAGSGGVRAARMAAAAGTRVAVVEEKELGGTCVNVGCVPKKLFYYASHLREDFHDSAAFGWQLPSAGFDWPTLRDNKDQEILRLNGVYGRLLDASGVSLIEGRARLLGPHSVQVGESTYTAEKLLIATGSWPYVPDFPGREQVITSNEVFHLDELPRRAVVVGGGYIAVEFAGIFNGLGVETTQLYRGDTLLRHFDADLRRVATEEIPKKGVDLRLQRNVLRVDRQDDGSLQVQVDDGSSIDCDLVLYATGRRANTSDLGIENTAISLRDDGSIPVDECYRSTEKSILAIGDVIGGPELTPLAIAQGMAVVDQLVHNAPRHVSLENLPTAIFCQPNIGTVGLTEAQARERFAEVDVYRSRFRALRHSLGSNPEQTFMKLLVEPGSDRVLGVHMVGPDAGEIIQGFAVALNAGATKRVFDTTIGIHPTSAEEFVTMREADA